MYIASARAGVSREGRGRVATNVVALGLVSLVTDVSSEMVTAVLPLYLVLGLGFTPLQFGLVDGLYSGVTAFVRLVGGNLADRWQRRKLVAGIGYGMSAVAKLGLMAVSGPWLGPVIAFDRTGKGLRTAPRDALITLSSSPSSLGRAFGVHRAMDTVGAFLGPLVAFGLLWTFVDGYDVVFFTSFCIAVFGVLLLVLFVREQPTEHRAASLRLRPLLRDRALRRVCLWAGALGLVMIGDGFIFLLLQDELDIAPAFVAVLPLGTAGVYLVLAVPLGKLADRIGRWQVFLAGHVALLLAYVALLGAVDGIALLVVVLVAHGVFYAATDGVLMAVAGPLVPPELRTSGLALLQTAQAVARLVASVLFGALWTAFGANPALVCALSALAVVLVLARRVGES